MSWDEIAQAHVTDKASIGPRGGLGHGYMGHYERILSKREIHSVLEIGVQSGGSLAVWAEVFPSANVLGIDIDPDCAQIPGPFDIVIGDAGDREAMGEERLLLRPYPYDTFDLIIDDGSHALRDTAANMDVWAPRLAPGGVYVVEDVVIGSTSWVQDLNKVVDLLLSHCLTPFAVERSQMPWVAHDHYGGMMAVVFADASCDIPEPA